MEEKFKEMSETERLEYVASLVGVSGMKGMVKDDRVMTGHVVPKFLQIMYGWPELERLAMCVCVMPHAWQGHRHKRDHTAWYVLDGTLMSDDASSEWSDGHFITVPGDKREEAENMLQYLGNGLIEGHFSLDDQNHIKFRMCIRLTGNRDDDLGEFGGAAETMEEMLLPWVPFVMLACTDGVKAAKNRHKEHRRLMKLDGPDDLDKFMHSIKDMTPAEMSQLPTSALRFLEGLVKIMRIPSCVEMLKMLQNGRDLEAGMSKERMESAQASNEEALEENLPDSVKERMKGKEDGLADLDVQF